MLTPSAATPRVPRATYRLQFNRFFTFQDAAALVPYLHDLGISDVYASPYLEARPGSMHGYDISNHNALNPEIGTTEDYTALTGAIGEHGMGHLLDIVPNHMGIAEARNPWWADVLENGPSSRFASFFDIDWHPLKPQLAGKVLLPVLGDQFGTVLERGELQLRYADGRFGIDYFEHHFPVAPKSTVAVLREVLAALRLPDDDAHRLELESIVTALEHLPPRHQTDAASRAERQRERLISKRRLASLYESSAEMREALDTAIRLFNGRAGEARSFDRLEALLDDQAYRLAFWRVAAEEINYRRFFDINDLAGLRVERPEVFQESHRLILQLLSEGKVTGLRIDHPDGLFDPRGYLRHLQHEAASRISEPSLYILVEKILTGEEELPGDWPVAGTVGYEFMNRLNGLFVATESEAAMSAVYEHFERRAPEFDDLVYDKKKLILRAALASELNVLAHLLSRLSEQNRRSRDFTLGSLTDALRETIACFPVYRTYIDARSGQVSDRDQQYITEAVGQAKRRNRSTSALIFDFVRDILLLRWPDDLDEDARREHARFVMRFQQLTGPVMAKGVEDTTFYIYNRLVSLNEVGGEPDVFGLAPAEFHQWVQSRQDSWPNAMNSTSTHDTKRSEDVRARINVLSEIPEVWAGRVSQWARWNAHNKTSEDHQAMPDRNDEYLLYQTLVGAWPLQPMDAEAHGEFVQRIQQYMEKATREAKVHTSWINPNETYDAALRDFIGRILERNREGEQGERQNRFAEDVQRFQAGIAPLGMLNALSQTLLKLTCPGVPDIYQAQEIWDFSLVDPDNRRPVDYALRRKLLDGLGARLQDGDQAAFAKELVDNWTDGRIKMYVIHQALRFRREHPELFQEGLYHPLAASGDASSHGVAFVREHGETQAIVVVPRLIASLGGAGDYALPGGEAWAGSTLGGTQISGRYRNWFTGEEVVADEHAGEGQLPLAALLDSFPLALLERTG
jgi:(1->4)-alpha-D-glucan 1-alpha-D-glucosylmutase